MQVINSISWYFKTSFFKKLMIWEVFDVHVPLSAFFNIYTCDRYDMKREVQIFQI